MTPSSNNLDIRRLSQWLLVAAAAALLPALGVFAVWPRSAGVYRDGQSIRMPAKQSDTRSIVWQPPQRVHFDDGALHEYEPRLSWDENTLFLVRGKAGADADIFVARRTPAGWSPPAAIEAIRTEYDELGPETTPDGTALYFYSDRPGGFGRYDIWMTRLIADDWQPPVNLGPAINSEFKEYGPAVAADGDQLFFASNRPVAGADRPYNPQAWPATVREDIYHRTYDLYSSSLSDVGPGPAQSLSILNTP